MKKKILIIVLVIGLIIAGVGAFLYFNNPKKKMFDAIENQIVLASNRYKEKKIKSKITTNGNVKIMGTEYAKVNSELYYDTINNKSLLSFALKYLGETGKLTESMKYELYFNDNKMYFKSEGKVYYIDLESTDKSSFSEEEIKAFVNIVKDSFNYGIPNNCFSVESKNVGVIDKTLSAKKYTLKMTKDNIYNYVKYLLDKIDESDKVPNIKKTIFSNTKKDEILKNVKESMGKKDSKKTFLEYSVYISKNVLVSQEINIYGDSNMSMVFQRYDKGNSLFNNYFYVMEGKEKTLEISYDEKEALIKKIILQ